MRLSLALTAITALCAAGAIAGERGAASGKNLYLSACAACHGADGRGVGRETVGFDVPVPDLTDCNFATREADADWAAVIHQGGPARGFSPIMPAYGEALTRAEIDRVLGYVRGFCPDRAWPRGELNLPRPLVTEKAFPEDEAVVTTTIDARSPSAFTQELVYEKRFGARNQVEVALPFEFADRPGRSWAGGVGDLALGYKRVLYHNPGSIFSISGEAILPTGDSARGFGNGVTVFESFLTYGQLLPRDSFVQLQGGYEVPTHAGDVPKAAFWRAALGRGFTQGGGFGRAWFPMVELLASRDFETGANVNFDVLPQFQVTLSRRQHIRANFGVRVPATNTAGRPIRLMFYLLWDWFDGGLREGW